MLVVNLLTFVLLIALTAFFVAVEFAIVKVRGSRIDQLVAEGRRNAAAAKKVVSHLDEYLSACQLGITVTALGLGWLGEPTVERLFHPLLSVLPFNAAVTHLLSLVLAFTFVTFIHVVVGELAPKSVAIQKSEELTLLFARPIILFYKLMYPFIWSLNHSARKLVGLFGLKPASEHELAHSEEELRILLSESYKSGEINQNEWRYVNNIFEFDERIAKEIMVPRTEMICIHVNDSVEEVAQKLKVENYTRYPVIDGDKDHIMGVLNIKMLVNARLTDHHLNIRRLTSPIIRVMETIPIHDLLVRMQTSGIHMAILIDEYGGTSGLVTVEDLIEEIIGEIKDEFDRDEVSKIRRLKRNDYIIDAKVPIREVNQLLRIDLSAEEVDTIGGWFLSKKADLEVSAGEAVEEEGCMFKVHEADGYHIKYLEVKKIS
ncbi:CBS domain containing-hemolysin-like protein [Neobacillus niacini]|uniref:hemolysin family protein n=1 Tax=Neobacillus niacini TaxID=86668 RepID=UPI002855F09D|nr:hemolysin family protein [Neobacillus niacini]MDR7079654.1 CBS domain containing-hemolysin-like protein [Neobacillus niacini]